MNKNRVLICIRGGCLESVKADRPDELAVDLVDHDDRDEGPDGPEDPKLKFDWAFPVEHLPMEPETETKPVPPSILFPTHPVMLANRDANLACPICGNRLNLDGSEAITVDMSGGRIILVHTRCL